MVQIDRSRPVLVTGATGYVAGWLVKKLLEEGLTVHAAVRNPDDDAKLKCLKDIGVKAPGAIKFFRSDLMIGGSYDEAMNGCELVYHTASPFISYVKDPVRDLLEPAVNGTRNVLESANRVPSVKRVVLTSSCASIYGDNIDLANTPNGVYTEEVWNTTSSLEHQAYFYSKVMAEKEAWKINREQSRWDMVVINPSLVIGPAVNPFSITSESFKILKQFGDGSTKTGVPVLGIGVVDVRDLAWAHFQAGFVPEAEGRNIISGHNTTFLEMAEALVRDFGDKYPIPRKELPKFMVWLFGPMLNKILTRKYISRNVGYPFNADNSKGIKSLGVTYRPLEESMIDTFKQMAEQKMF